MVEIAKAISFDVKVLIMDEPTSVLTMKDTQVLFRLIKKLAARGIGIVYITHRLGEIKEIADRVVVLRDGEFVASKKIEEVSERVIAKLMVGREISQSIAGNFKGSADDIAVEMRNVNSGILRGISFRVSKGEIVGFSGLIGAGRSELMEVLFGFRKCQSGEVLLNGKPVTIRSARAAIAHGMAFSTEDRKETGLILCRGMSENMEYIRQVKTKGLLNNPRQANIRSVRMIDRLNIRCISPKQLVKNLSGGNQQKVVLAKWLEVNPDIFIVDEPTRGIDVGARAEIYRIINDLAKEGKTVLVVSSDLTEVLSICQRIIVMHEGKITGEFIGNDRTEENIMNCAANV